MKLVERSIDQLMAELDERDSAWELHLCERCAEEPTQAEERREWNDDDLRRRIRELSALYRSVR